MGKLKVLLMAVYTESMQRNAEEIGICSIASYLEQNGYEVKLADVKTKEIDSSIFEYEPNILGIPVYTPNKDKVYWICNLFREKFPNIYIVVGGIVPTFGPVDILEEAPFIDFVIRGEGETVMLDLVSHLEGQVDLKDIKGLTYRNNNCIITNENQEPIKELNTLPFPSRKLLEINKYKVATISTSRGCIGRCSFCCSGSFWGKWRGRTPANIVEEIEHIIDKFNVNVFSIIDNSFEDPGFNVGRMTGIAEEILKKNLKISYYINVRVEFYRKSSKELINLLKESGLTLVFIGIESGNDDDLDLYKKNNRVEDNCKSIEFFRENGFYVSIGFINFNPYSTLEKLHKNIDFLEKYDFASHFLYILNYSVLFPNTSLYEKVKNDSLYIGGNDDLINYNFVDSRIKPLLKFINDYFNLSNTEIYNFIQRVSFLLDNYLLIIEVYKLRFAEAKYNNAYKILIEHINEIVPQINIAKKELNRNNAKWFRELLDLAERQWDENTAYQIIEDNLHKEDISALIKTIENKIYKFNYKISKLGPEYTGFLYL